jgi:hypothetical protein
VGFFKTLHHILKLFTVPLYEMIITQDHFKSTEEEEIVAYCKSLIRCSVGRSEGKHRNLRTSGAKTKIRTWYFSKSNRKMDHQDSSYQTGRWTTKIRLINQPSKALR